MDNKVELTQEGLETLYKRASEYGMVAFKGKQPYHVFDREPHPIEITEDGMIKLGYSDYKCGEQIDYSEFISPEVLTEDLEETRRKRKEREAAEAEERRIKNEKLKKEREEREKKQRYSQYLKLKEEFENEDK
jgi:hypothetical protein